MIPKELQHEYVKSKLVQIHSCSITINGSKQSSMLVQYYTCTICNITFDYRSDNMICPSKDRRKILRRLRDRDEYYE